MGTPEASRPTEVGYMQRHGGTREKAKTLHQESVALHPGWGHVGSAQRVASPWLSCRAPSGVHCPQSQSSRILSSHLVWKKRGVWHELCLGRGTRSEERSRGSREETKEQNQGSGRDVELSQGPLTGASTDPRWGHSLG
jgi:hypothetical protein